MRALPALALFALALPTVLWAEPAVLAPVEITDWKAVYGRIEAKDRIPARARLGGTLVSLLVSEGDVVEQGQVLAEVVDEKLAFQVGALTAQLDAAQAQLVNAETELKRGEDLLKRGVATAQALDALRTQVDVLKGQIEGLKAQRRVIEQQAAEGKVLAPVSGRVLEVPVAAGGVVMMGEPIANLGGGGIFLRLAVPERHATSLHAGDSLQIEGADGPIEGRLAKVYPLIENGRVIADVEVEGLPDTFVDARVLVRLPVGSHAGLLVPKADLITRSGLDFVAIATAEGTRLRAVVPGPVQMIDTVEMVEILSGLQAGDAVLPAAEANAEVSHD